MKKVSIFSALLVGIALFVSSCSMQDVTPEDGTSALMDLMFSATSHDTTRTGGHGPRNVTEIAVTELPAAVTTYIQTTYAGAKVDRAGKLEDGSFVVKITKADGTSAGLHFDATGKFLHERTDKKAHTHIAAADLPATITSYITANYVGSTIKKAAKFEDNTYHVAVQKADNTLVGLAFDATGKFVSELAMKDKGQGKKKGHGKGKG